MKELIKIQNELKVPKNMPKKTAFLRCFYKYFVTA